MRDMVKLTAEQKGALEALDNRPDDEIDLSDIPEITDWSGFKMGLLYCPVMKDTGLDLCEYVVARLEE